MFGISEREQNKMRIERLVAMLNQSNDLIVGLGQYVKESDPNWAVMDEVIKSNRVVLDQELDALNLDDSKIITRI